MHIIIYMMLVIPCGERSERKSLEGYIHNAVNTHSSIVAYSIRLYPSYYNMVTHRHLSYYHRYIW